MILSDTYKPHTYEETMELVPLAAPLLSQKAEVRDSLVEQPLRREGAPDL